MAYINQRSISAWFRVYRRLRGMRFDLIMLNSVWNVPFSFMPALASLLGVLKGPILLLPHGELEEGALALKSIKKRSLGWLVRLVYRRAVCLYGATSVSEGSRIRLFFREVPFVRTENGHPDRIDFQVRTGGEGTREPFTVLFLGRVHPTKGLAELLEGLKFCASPVRLLIAGPPVDRRYWEKCCGRMRQLPANVSVSVLGLVDRDHLTELFRDADLLGMLTAGENYGHVIAEALQAGCPVLLTRKTPWTTVVEGGGGEIVDDRENAQEVGLVLERWASKSHVELAESREVARAAFDQSPMRCSPDIVSLALTYLDAQSLASDSEDGSLGPMSHAVV